ncbi:MAG: 16S rRNA (cytidine(1402)-2'-O)-methyltransferase [Alphaproteobacteria bacterium]|nr:16S rRNA (cytidine(1402)-2'-O)-methyltransferase [Alphaproteobacteria bacterium]
MGDDLAPGLYVTATPIGNAQDVTLRALTVLKNCDLIAAEDTRVTGKLLAIHGIRKPLGAYNDHNAVRERPKLIARLRQGARIALVSDAGTPLISDPGFKLVREAIQEGLPVHAIPGASAVMTGLTLAGLPTDRFLFAGFLPVRSGERKTALAELKDIRATLVFFESAQRLSESLADMAEVFGLRTVAVARELTKLHEEVRRGLLGGLAEHYARQGAPKGEVTVIVSPPHDAPADTARIDAALDKALEFMPLRAAVDLVSEMLEAPRKPVYERALAKKADG